MISSQNLSGSSKLMHRQENRLSVKQNKKKLSLIIIVKKYFALFDSMFNFDYMYIIISFSVWCLNENNLNHFTWGLNKKKCLKQIKDYHKNSVCWFSQNIK